MLYKKIFALTFIFISVALCHDEYPWYNLQPSGKESVENNPADSSENKNVYNIADPIDAFSGAYTHTIQDLFIPGNIPLNIALRYCSRMYYNSPFGFGWFMNYDMRVTEFSDGKILVRDPNGYRQMFTLNGNEYTSPAGLNAYLIKTDTGYIFKEKQGASYVFDTLGYLKQIVNAKGNEITMTYSAQPESIMGYHPYSNYYGVVARRYLLTQVSDGYDRHLHFYYDTRNRIDSITGPAGYKIDYTVDSTGDLVEINKIGGSLTRSIQYKYNNFHCIDTVINSNDEIYLVMEYDSKNRVTKQKYGYNEFEIAFDDGDSITTLTDPRDNNTYYKFNNKMLLAWIANEYNDTTKFEYNSDYKLTKTIGPRGDTTKFSYDFGDLLSVVDALYDTTRLHYTADFHMLDSIVDPAGHITKFEYDTLGNLTTVINALGKETEYEYDTRGNVIQATDPMGHAVYYSYDPDDGLTHNSTLYGSESYDSLYPTKIWATIEGRTIAMKFDYDYRRGLRVASGDPNGNVTYFDYDSLNQLTKVFYSDNTPNSGHTNTPSMRYYYDVKGNMTKKENYYGHNTEFVYDTLNQLREVKEHKGDSTYNTKYTYDNNGNLIKFANSAGDTTYYRYDALNRLVKTIYPDSTPSDTTDNPAYAYRYDNPDDPVNLYRRIDANGDTTAYYYDLLNRLDSLVYPNGTAVTYGYNRDYTLHELIDSTGTTSFVYDAAHQLDSIYYPDENYTMKLSYYDNGLRKRETFNKDGTVGYDMFYTYDSLNRLKEVIDSTVDKSIIYTYDINPVSYDTSYGNLVKIAYPNNIVMEYKYLPCCSRIGRIMTRNTSSGDTIQSFEYEYDYAGNRSDLYLKDSSHIAYTYDSLNRLVFTEKNDSTDTQLWSRRYYYDRLGNVTRLISTESVDTSDYYYYYYPGTNRLKEARGYTYEFDDNGNPTTCDDGRNFYYDYENRMTELTGHGYPTQFYYNGFGDRAIKIEDPEGSKGFYQKLGGRSKRPQKSELYDDLTYAGALGDSLHDGTRDLGEVSFDCDKDNLTWEISHKNLIGIKESYNDYERLYITLDIDQIYRKGNLRLPDSMMTKVHPAAAWEYCIYVYNDQDFGYFDQNGKKYERPNTMSVRYLNSGANGKIQIKLSSAVLGKVNRVRYTVATTMPGFVNADRRRNQRSRAIDVYPGGIRTMDNSGEIGGYAYGTVSDAPSYMGGGGGIHYKVTHKYWHNDVGRQINDNMAWSSVAVDRYYGYGYGLLFRKQGETGSHEYLHTDALGSVTAVTDADGNVVGTYDYDPYGELLTSSENLGNFGFTGQEVDWETELYHFPARYYEPRWGRFTTPDPIKEKAFYNHIIGDGSFSKYQNPYSMGLNTPSDFNLYLYVMDNPSNLVDPQGLFGLSDIRKHFQKNINKFNDMRRWRGRLVDLFRTGEPQLFMRHCTASCMVGKKYGEDTGRIAGIGWEVWGFIRVDIPHIWDAFWNTGDWSFNWSFSLQALSYNEAGFDCANNIDCYINDDDLLTKCLRCCLNSLLK